MDQQNAYTEKEYEAQEQIRGEFGSWNVDEKVVEQITITKWKFHELLCYMESVMPPHNRRYKALVATKLEEACMMAVKGLSKPE